MDVKTNPMRHLDKLGIPYKVHSYDGDSYASGTEVAVGLGEDPARVFKTLVTVGKSKKHYVFVIPVDLELDLKKAAASVNEKSLEMVQSKELLSLTGYVHLGCSPMCMKRDFVTTVDSTVDDGELFYVSAGKIGVQLEMKSEDFFKAGNIKKADLTRPKAR